MRIHQHLVVVFLLTGITYAANFNVKAGGGGDFTTIQACAAAMASGDTCTVFAGTYNEHVTVPAGGVGAYKTLNVNGADVVNVLDFTINSHVKIVGFHITNPSAPFGHDCVAWVNGSTDIFITNNTFYACGSHAMISGVNSADAASFLYVQGNTFSYACSTNTSPNVCKGLHLCGDHHLIENNDISHVSDGMDMCNGSHNVYRNNTMHDVNISDCGSNSSNCHIDLIESEPSATTKFNMYEGNTFNNGVGANTHGIGPVQGDVCAGQCSNLIIRFNVVSHVGSGAILDDNAGNSGVSPGFFNVKAYNNTWVDLNAANIGPGGGTNGFDNNSTNGSQINELFYYPESVSDFNPYLTDASSVASFDVGHNLAWCTGGTCSLHGKVYGSGNFTDDPGNVLADPLFVNYAGNNFNLQPGSPAIGAGTSLTTAVGAGTASAALTVADAAYFQDGFTIPGVQADWIRIGTTTTVQISSVNYSTNVLTLATPATWSSGDPIYLYKNSSGAVVLTGASPTIGNFVPPVAAPGCTDCIVISNSGTANVNISSVTASPSQFTQTNDCPAVLVPSAFCTAHVSFTPTSAGPITGSLTVLDDAPGSPHISPLSGTGIAPVVTLLPSSVAFGNQITGSVSSATNVMLSNTGTGLLTISSIALTGADPTQFTQSGNCGSTLAAGTSCTIAVRFAPTTVGAKSASLTVTDSATGSPHSSTLTGTGIAGTPVASLTPSSLTYASTIIGVSSAVQTATLQNTGTANLIFSSIAITGDFSQTNNCVSPIVAPTSCSIAVKFTPTAVGTRTGTLSVTDNASGSPHTVALSGIGASSGGGGGIAVITPSSLTFTNQITGTPSAAQIVTLKNTDTVTMTVNSVTFGGGNPTDYAETDNCKPSLAAGAACTVNVTFTPLAVGSRPATLVFSDSSAGSPQSVPITGTGIAPFPVVNVVPTSLNFGSAQATTTTPAQTITVKNVGTALMHISGITKTGTNTGDYALTNGCGATLAINATCILSITFTPATTGTRTANISIASDDPASPTIVPMTGVGTPAPAPHVQLSASFLTFPLTQTGNTTPAQNVIVSNIGDATLTISGITLGAPNATDYVLTNPCGASLAAGISCTLQIAFRPIAGGTRTSSVSIADNASDTPQVISLTGNAFVGTPTVDLSTSNITFTPSQIILTTSNPSSILLTNNGTAALAITSITASSDLSPGSSEFVQTNNCGSSVPAHGSCTINVTFTPQATGARTGKVTFLDNAVGGSQVVILMGTGINPPPPPGNSATGMGGKAGMGGKVSQGVH